MSTEAVMVTDLFVDQLPPRAWGTVDVTCGMVQGARHIKFVKEAIANRVKGSVGSKGCGAAFLGLGTG